ncbi:hypothetical protein B296_00005350 [Ensete ventricosum]|uniref:Uncharacterized protein n=1 Tax=Ensete ventricosum TaxID=4639 RepID=A0A427B2F8_ENSVE|nr:hypothetical protein B296_00005350 [Ensete ventricosum]
MVVDFGGYVSLAEKRLQDGRGGRQQHDCRRLRMAWMAGDGCREERNRGGRRLEDCRGKQGSRGGQHTMNGVKAATEAREVTPRWIRKAARERKEVAEPTSGASKVAVGGGFLSPSRLQRRQQRGEGAADARLGGSTESRDWKVSAGCGQRRWQRRLGSNRVEGNSRHGNDNGSGRGLGKQRQQGGGDCGGRGGHGWIVTIFFPKEVRSRSSTEVGSPPLLLKRCGRRREVAVSKDGVRKVPLLIGADATVVGHEEDGLVQKDTSAGEQQPGEDERCWLRVGVGESYDRRLMELGLSRAEGSNEIAATKGFSTSFTIEEAEERMVARVAGPQRATTDRGENRHRQQIVEKEKREQRRLRNRRSSYPYGEEEVMKLMQQGGGASTRRRMMKRR